MYLYIHTCLYYIYVYVCISLWHVYICLYIFRYIHLLNSDTSIHICLYIFRYIHRYIQCMYVYIGICVCVSSQFWHVYTYMSKHIAIHTPIHISGHADSQRRFQEQRLGITSRPPRCELLTSRCTSHCYRAVDAYIQNI